MPARREGASDLASLAADDVAPPATYSITKDGMTVWYQGKAVLQVPHKALTGIAMRCLVAWHEA